MGTGVGARPAIVAKDFNLRHTVESGQPLTFYSSYGAASGFETLSYVTGTGSIALRYSKGSGRLQYVFSGRYGKSGAEKEVRSRLGLDHDIADVYRSISTDEFINRAINEFYGMRITRNEPWEATLCFVISQFNNIKRIRGIMLRMIERFGEEFDGKRLFPAPEAIASADMAEIRACGTGFRDRYIKHAAEQFASGFEYSRLHGMGYEDAKARLMELDGIGDKVADCILLFGYGRYDAFPIDVWIKRVVERAYFKGRRTSIARIHEFSTERWGRYRGYAQQYLFEFARRNKIG